MRLLPEGQAATSGGQSQHISALKSHYGGVMSPSEVVVSIEECRRGLSVDEDVIEVHTNDSLHYEVTEDVVHHRLEGGRTVCESEEHDQRFEESVIRSERGLLLISLLDADIVVAPPDLQLGEVSRTTEVVDELGDEGKRFIERGLGEYVLEVVKVVGDDELLEHKQWDHAIELEPSSTPSSCKVYPLAPNEQAELDTFLEENLKSGRIRPSKSPMASPVFFIKKKDGSLRLVQDYRALNAMTVKNRYPLPLISEPINNLRGARYFTKLDVRWGYNNVRIKERDEWKATFRTNRGLFEPLVMFFGLTNSPATFQTMMNDIFRDLIAQGVVCVYLDDILIYTKTLKEHRRITRIVLDRLREHRLFLKPEKCEFERTEIEYLGLIISHGTASMDPVKVAGVAEWPTPKNKKEVQSFLGFTNFYRQFICDFFHHARPLFDLTAKDVAWTWGSAQQDAFNALKCAITSQPVLIFPDDDRPFQVEADSSDFATGTVLFQQSPEDGKWHPITFYSKSLNAIERNYEIYDKEMLAIIRALKEWRHFLEGAQHKVEIYTDHKNLEYFLTAKKLNRRQARWSLYLANFDFVLHHRPGRTGVLRALQGLIAAGEKDKILRDIRRGNREGVHEDVVAKAATALKSSRSGVRSVRSAEWSEDQGILMFRGRIYVPNIPKLRRRIVEQHHDSRVAGHPGRWKTLELVSRSYWWPRSLPTDEDPEAAPNRQAAPAIHPGGALKHCVRGLHRRAP
ncbi:putative retrotransposable element tf2 155 kda protein type 1-like [Lyophyllum shimeji]|uniref:Retrotransposable element tf2 155 kDa protein type 1-like n=1 Tax=Lyophyllum shimeji TaxID=47721 RepID=A0A9P3PTT5_LYOSH|nr:putative retrotransposable element tf2 155 kda protein type 1-like [Lyophyllum shimeji]